MVKAHYWLPNEVISIFGDATHAKDEDAKWRIKKAGRRFAESFLRALGWPAERIAVKWRNIDVVCVFRAAENPGALPLLD